MASETSVTACLTWPVRCCLVTAFISCVPLLSTLPDQFPVPLSPFSRFHLEAQFPFPNPLLVSSFSQLLKTVGHISYHYLRSNELPWGSCLPGPLTTETCLLHILNLQQDRALCSWASLTS